MVQTLENGFIVPGKVKHGMEGETDRQSPEEFQGFETIVQDIMIVDI